MASLHGPPKRHRDEVEDEQAPREKRARLHAQASIFYGVLSINLEMVDLSAEDRGLSFQGSAWAAL